MFKNFYTEEIRIICPQNGGGYSDSETETEKCRVLADVQPYTGEMREKEYGFSNAVKKKIYFENADIEIGDYAVIGDTKYRVVYSEKRLLGNMAVLEEVVC